MKKKICFVKWVVLKTAKGETRTIKEAIKALQFYRDLGCTMSKYYEIVREGDYVDEDAEVDNTRGPEIYLTKL